MSNISGDTFFIENSVNCSDLGSINGQVTFIDCSINCGQVLNAIFSGYCVRNDGQAFGCTIFCNSYSFGYVCGTGILRGNSVLYGAADCVILCDQSAIDLNASVADRELLVTTGIPTNIHSYNNAYYTYSSGVSTVATGGWSNYYFAGGGISSNIYISTGQSMYAVPYQAQDNCLYYHSAYYCLGYIVDGAYANGYFSSGCVNCNFSSICALNPSGYVPVENENPNQWYLIYNSGTVAVANGLLPRVALGNGLYLDFFKNGFIDLQCNLTVGVKYISTLNNYICLASTFRDQVCDIAFGCNQIGYAYCFATLNGATSIGYFNSSCEGVSIYSFLGESKTIPIDVTFTCNSPLQAQDDSLYYIYCTGSAIVANGLYSNYAITGGAIDATCSTNMPTGAIDGGCQIYEAGAALCVTGVNYILADNNYYGKDGNSFSYKCGELPSGYDFLQQGLYDIKLFKSNCNLGGFIIYAGESSPISPLMDISTLYCSVGVLEGVFFTYNNKSFKSSNAYDCCFEIDTTFNQGTPLEVLPSIYFLYCGGCGVIPNGVYTNYAFTGSFTIDYNYNCLLPQQPLDDIQIECSTLGYSGKYYVYNGGTGYGATGAYSNFYYRYDFIKDGFYSQTGLGSPEAAQDDCKYYQYYGGCPFIVTGCRNDVPGYNGSPSAIYNFGDNGEYNPTPICIDVLYGPYTYTYYSEGVPFAKTGAVDIRANGSTSVYVCCGPGCGCTSEGRYTWLYHSTLCCGFDPVPLGYADRGLLSFDKHTVTCLTESSSTDTYSCTYYCNNELCCNGIVMIDNRFCLNFIYNAVYDGVVNLSLICHTCWACRDLFCDDYCTCTFDLYCDLYCDVYCDVYNTEEPPVCIGQECCGSVCYGSECYGSDSCQVCCGQTCTGSEVTCSICCIYCNAIGFTNGYMTGYHTYLCVNDNGSVTCDSLDIIYEDENGYLNSYVRTAFGGPTCKIYFIDLV